MEGILKFLVVLVVIAGIIWVVSPVLSKIIVGGIYVPPNLKIGEVTSEIIMLENTTCMQDMCEFRVSGKISNEGGAAKNVLLTLFFDKFASNLGSVNMPLIASIGEKQAREFSYAVNYSCDANQVRATILSFSEGV
jgi:hypothetical protein